MPSKSSDLLKIDPDLVAAVKPDLERTVQEMMKCLDQLEMLQNQFRQNFLKIFDDSGSTAPPGSLVRPDLAGTRSFIESNLAAGALAHLRYAADQAELACELLP